MNRVGAVLIGGGIAVAIVLLLRRAAQSSAGEPSACEKAAAAAEKIRPGAGAAMLAGCALLNSDAAKAVVELGQKATGAAGEGFRQVWNAVTGQRDRADKLTLDRNACPDGTRFRISGNSDGVTLVDHRLSGDYSERALATGNLGARCEDSDGNVVGTVMPDGFHPFDTTTTTPTPPPTAGTLATSTPTGTSRDGRWSGGVSVT